MFQCEMRNSVLIGTFRIETLRITYLYTSLAFAFSPRRTQNAECISLT